MFFHNALLHKHRKNGRNPIGLRTGQITLMSNLFCQENLTKILISLENRDTYKFLLKMSKSEKLAPVLALGAMLSGEPALAEGEDKGRLEVAAANQHVITELRDCMAEAKAHVGTKKEKIAHLRQCKREEAGKRIAQQKETIGEQERVLAEQQRILAALDEALQDLRLQVTTNGQILSEEGEVLAQIVTINGRLIMKRESLDDQIVASRKRQQQMLDEAERILQRLATS